MILLNFSHPLTVQQMAQIEDLAGQKIDNLIERPSQFDQAQPFIDQVQALVAGIPFTPAAWQTEAILVNLPSLSTITALLLADLHGRMGYFPPVLCMRPVAASLPPRYEVAEILNLNEVRQRARLERG